MRGDAGGVTRETDALRAPYRPVRPVGAADDAPWPGLLVGLPSGERRVLVDAKTLGSEWRGWDAAPHGHVLAPVDVVRARKSADVLTLLHPVGYNYFATLRGKLHWNVMPADPATRS